MCNSQSRIIPTNAIGILDANLLEKRIMDLKETKTPTTTTTRLALFAAGVLFSVSALASGFAAPYVTAADTTSVVHEPKIYRSVAKSRLQS
jgi:F0F1-type ATP synthase membrane subunit c/vacuolar-type H+-ATPase subunit K